MIVHDDYIYIHMPVTGGTFITSVLENYYDGTEDVDHTAQDGGQAHNTFGSFYNSDKYGDVPSNQLIIGSIRNPYRYYLSVWGDMCYDYTIHGRGTYTFAFLDAYPGKANLIDDINDQNSFREWCKMLLHGNFDKFYHLRFNNSLIQGHQKGIVWYNFVILYCKANFQLSDNLIENSIVDEFIHTESIASDIVNIFDKHGLFDCSHMSKKDIQSLGKKNSREYNGTYKDYYDQELKELVKNRESCILEEFDYAY